MTICAADTAESFGWSTRPGADAIGESARVTIFPSPATTLMENG